ncbi:MAG TPA: DUF4388 domain-containing protein [Kofleriaceae bacterium]|nr:DUF4388 domain-containing protein [Kofleriaceae bacterium]
MGFPAGQSEGARILLVANPSESDEIARLLTDAGMNRPAIGWGGDETLALCELTSPQVVIMSASLEQGDARSLASALRATAEPGALRIVLIGDQTGPIRNALDASDFEIDRFVGRPLSAKALAFAVRSCVIESQKRASRDTGPTEPGTPLGRGRWRAPEGGPPPPAPPLEASLPEPPPLFRRENTSPRIDLAVEEAISSFVSDAMDALDKGWVWDENEGGGPTRPPRPAEEAFAAAARPTEPEVMREPTLILRGGHPRPSPMPPPAPPVRRTLEIEVTDPESGSPWGRGRAFDDEDDDVESSALDDGDVRTGPARSLDEEAIRALELDGDGDLEEVVDDLSGGIEFELDIDDSQPSVPLDPIHIDIGPAPGDTPPASPAAREHAAERGGGLGRELRKRMSMMADRLFPGRGERGRVDLGLQHDAHTEIDLASIGGEPEPAAPVPAAYEGLGGADTFADTNPLSRMERSASEVPLPDEPDDTGGERRRAVTGEPPARGDLADLDVATLLGRLLQSRFTGRAQFKRGAQEKVVHFEEGRPVFATSNLPHDRMGELLYREGKITREHQERARDLVVESGRRMGEILVEMGFLKPRELLPAVRHHVEDIVYSLFAWDAGEFVLASGEPSAERIRLTRHPAALVVEGVRRKYGREQLETRLGSAVAVVAVRSARQLGAIAAVADLSPSERAIIQKLDGERTAHQLADAVQVEHLVVLQLAFALVALGVAEVVDHGTSVHERAPSRGRSLVGETDLAIDRQRVLAKHALVVEADYFTLLGVRRDATSFEIRRAYEAARRDYAAACFPTELQRELAGELTDIGVLIEEAYQILRDERVRRSYQANLLD